jgi:hypothetical protein
MTQAERITEYLKQLTPHARCNLLNELERIELCGIEMPGISPVLDALRAEFRQVGPPQSRTGNPARFFFAPLQPFLVDADPDHPNPGRISRGSLSPIWEWISRDLLPTMARDYSAQMKDLIAGDKQREAMQVAGNFQTKVVKSLETTLSSSEAVAQIRAKLATYTASRSIFRDLSKMVCVLRARQALTKFEQKLPEKISKFDDARVALITTQLDTLAKNSEEAVPFALTLVANRLKTSSQLMRLATKPATSRDATDIAGRPYAIAITMVLDRLEDMRLALRVALRNNRVLVAKELLIRIYDTEYALQRCIDELDRSEWGIRLRQLMDAIAALVEAEVSRFPPDVGHVLGSRNLRTQESLAGRLSYLACMGRDAVHESAAFFKGLIGQG